MGAMSMMGARRLYKPIGTILELLGDESS